MPTEDNPVIEWSEFVNQAILQYKLPYFEVKYPTLDPISQSAVTAINEALFERAITCGHPGIAISVCDYSREALAFSFSRAIGNILESEPIWDFDTRFPDVGQYIALGDVVVEYQGIARSDDDFGNRLCFKQKGSNKNNRGVTSQLPLSKLPLPQPCTSGAALTTSRQAKPADAQREFNNLPDLAKDLVNRVSGITSSVVMTSSSSPFLNIPPTMLNKAVISFDGRKNMPIFECLCTGRFANGSIKTNYKYPVQSTKSMLTPSRTQEGFTDLFDVVEYLDKGGKVDVLVVEAPTAECLENIKGKLSELISDYRVPVIVFCEESILRRTDALSELQIPLFIWGKSQLQDLENLTRVEELGLTHRQECFVHSAKRVQVVQDTGELSLIAKTLYSISDSREKLSEKEESALIALLNIFSQTIKRSELLIADESLAYWKRIDDAVHSLTTEGFSLTEGEVADIRDAAIVLKSLCRPQFGLPKEVAVFEAIHHSVADLDHDVCLVVPKGTSEVAASEYWMAVLEDEGLSKDKVRIVTPRTFLKQDCTSDNEEVFITGWFRREEMERLLDSGLSSIYTTFLYKGVEDIDLENKWYVSADSYWKKHHSYQKANAKQSLSKLGVSMPIEVQECSKEVTRQKDNSLPGIVRSITREYSQSQASTSGEGILGRPVWFTNGSRRWLRIGETGGDTLLVVTDALDPDSEDGFTRKTANAIQDGDVVLRTESDDAALDEACQAFGSYERALSVARSWYEPIAKAKETISRAAIIRKIAESGCVRNRLTITHWVDDQSVIAPSEPADIMHIGNALNYSFTEEQVARIMKAASAVRGDRISGGRRIAKDIAAAFVEMARSSSSLEEAAAQFEERHSDMGEIELLYVDYVGDSAVVPAGRFGWYAD